MITKRGLCLTLLLLTALTLVGCATTDVQEDKSRPTAQDIPKPPTPSNSSNKTENWEWQITKEEAVEEEVPRPAEITIPRELKTPEIVLPTPVGEKLDVAITFHSADVREVLKVLLGELLDVNYVIDKMVSDEITFRMVGQFYEGEMLNIIQAVLNVYDLAMVQKNGIIEVTSLQEAKMEPGPLILGKKVEKRGVNIVTQVVPLNYVAPQALIPTLRAFMTKAGTALAPNDSHAIVVVDKASNMRRLIAMIGAFDVPFFAGRAVKFYDIKYVNVANLAKDLESLAKNLGGAPIGPAAQIGFVPLTDSNKLLVAVANPKMLPTVDFWVRHMDVKSPRGTQIYIYKLQHKKADSMASILNDLFAQEGLAKAPVAGQPGAPGEVGPASQAGPVKVISDADSNSLVIRALPQDYQNIRRIIEVMDATPKQVLIEVLIAEVTLTDALAYGVEYFFRNRGLTEEGFATSLLPSGVSSIARGSAPATSPSSVALSGGTRGFILHRDVDIIIN
ncbi:MAG: secretin N-terminal domain-containing protein, partial [Candidatus Brocadiales bacterium]